MEIKAHCVRDLMTSQPVTLAPDDDLSLASDLMRLGRVRHVPIVDDAGSLVGMLSDRDVTCGALLRAVGIEYAMERRALSRVQIREVMSKRVSSVAPETTLAEAASQMNTRKISCLPVVESGELVGVLTEQDFVTAIANPDSKLESSPSTPADPSAENMDWSWLESECDRLREIRDETRVQLKLATMEARDRYEKAERCWADLESHVSDLRTAGDDSLDEIARVGRNFVKETSAIYEDLRRHLEAN